MVMAAASAALSVLLLSGCQGTSPAARLPTATETPPAAPVSQEATATPVFSVTALESRTPTPSVTPTRSATPTLRPSQTFTPSQRVVLIRPSAPAPTSTVDAPMPTPIWPPSPLDRTENILVLGIDRRPDEFAWRTDTIMVVALDTDSNQVGVISIPRDLYVEIPDLGLGRINQADYFGEANGYPGGGGPALLGRVISDTLGIPTQHYARIEMDGLVRLVDALGGVTVTLDCPLYERTPDASSPNGVIDWSLPAGPVHLDGLTAKKFATYRYATTDFGRARRQQQLIWAIRDRALQVDVIPRIPELWKALNDTFSTDLGLLDFLKLARLGATLRADKVHGLVLGSDVLDYFVTSEGAWVLVISDYDRIAAEKDALFAARPLAAFNVGSESGGCPPAPTPPPTFTPMPADTPAGAATVEPTTTPTVTPTPSP